MKVNRPMKIKTLIITCVCICVVLFAFFAHKNYEETEISNEARIFAEEQFSGNMQYVLGKTTKEMQDYFKENGLHLEYIRYQSIGGARVIKTNDMEYLAIVTVYVHNDAVGIDTHIFENITLKKINGEWLVADIAYDI